MTIYKYKFLAVLVLLCSGLLAQTADQNYVKSTTYQVETTNGNVSDTEKIETVAYFDGLGRPRQTVSQRVGGNGEDLVTPNVYDALGRNPKQYLPYPIAGNNGAFVEAPVGVQETFYSNTFPGEIDPNNVNAYSHTNFEKSPLGRPLEQGAPGDAWKIVADSDSDRTIKYGHKLNGNDVQHFAISGSSLNHLGKHPINSLYMTEIKDENWQPGDGNKHTTREYTNRLGQVVLKRSYTINRHDTYYVYDDFGNLTYVLSPEASAQILDSNGNLVANWQVVMNELGYRYKYDSRNRLVEKKVPGKGWEYIVYNKLDQPVFTQDAILRANGNRWLFTKYDVFGRVILTGEQDRPDGETRSQLQNSVNTNYQSNYESRSGIPFTVGGTTVYYTHDKAAPTSTAGDITLHTINYYDSYDHIMEGMSLPGAVYGVALTNEVNGLPTVSRVRVLGENDWIHTHTGYDEKGRATYTKSVNPFLGSTDISRSLLDFMGKPLEVHSTHIKQGIATIQVMDYYAYDYAGRMLTHHQKIGSEEIQLIASNHYDALGQLIQKDVGGTSILDGYTDLEDVTISADGTITKETDAWGNGDWAARAKTRGAIPSSYDGGVELTVLQANKHVRFGFVETTGGNLPNADYHYGIHLKDDGGIDYWDIALGQWVQYSGTYAANHIFRVERTGNTIKYRHNNSYFYTATLSTDQEEAALVGKLSFNGPAGSVSNFGFFGTLVDNRLQAVNYKYNIRGWLTDINDVESGAPSSGFKTVDTYSDLFSMRINYNTLEGDYLPGSPEIVPLYNGNIAETVWRTANTDKTKRSYGYQYDALNRIRKGIMRHGEQLDQYDFQTHAHNVWNIGYDHNGNILSLKRTGYAASEEYDDLAYTYKAVNGVTTNRLAAVADNANGSNASKARGFVDGTNTGDDYVYDANGNMISDANKGITAITYNHLNLPETVAVNNGATNGIISYVYDAAGTKLKKSVTMGSNTDITEYANGYVYNNESGSLELQFVSHPEGYIMPTPSDTGGGSNEETKSIEKFSADTGQTTQTEYLYVFQYKDHLGNVRLTYADDDGNGSIDANEEIIEESNYMPYGLKHWGYNNNISSTANLLAQKWSFLGQEKIDDLGINWLTFRYRNYMPDIGRFFGSDPIAEEFFSISNYQFAHNSPVWKIELEGLEGAPTVGMDIVNHEPIKGNPGLGAIPIGDGTGNHGSTSTIQTIKYTGSRYVGGYPGQSLEEGVTRGIQWVGSRLANSNVSRETSENIQLGTNIFALLVSKGRNKKAAGDIFEQLTKTASTKSLSKITLNTSKLNGAGSDILDDVIKKTNNIADHLSPNDLKGAVKDILGQPVKIDGKVFDHLGEVTDALKGLGKQLTKLNKAIDKGNLTDDVLDAAKSLRTQLQNQKDQIQNILNNARKEASGF